MISQNLSSCAFFPAIRVQNAETERHLFTEQPWDDWVTRSNFTLRRRNGLLGCLASTLRILDHYSALPAPPAALVVLEDDARAHPKALAMLEEFVSSHLLGEPWDVARFYSYWQSTFPHPANISAHLRRRPSARWFRSAALGAAVVCFPSRFRDWGTQATLYRGPRLPAVLRHLRSAPLNDVDYLLSTAGGSPAAPLASWVCLADPAVEPLFGHARFGTDIPKTVEGGARGS
jgi:hypothetical protein